MSRVWIIAGLIACGALAVPAQERAPAAVTRPTTRPAGGKGSPGDSGVVVDVKSVKVDHLMFRRPKPDGTIEEVGSAQPVLIVTIEIANKGDKAVTYRTANGTPGSKDPTAAIRDSTGRASAVVQFEATLERVDGVKQATIKPGQSVTDVLAFLQLPEGVKPVTLLLPAKCHGNEGTWRVPLEGK